MSGDRLAQIEELRRNGQLGAITVSDVLALVEIAKAAREQAHEHPGEEWGYDASGIHVYDGPDCAGQGCPQCDALARLDSGATEGDA